MMPNEAWITKNIQPITVLFFLFSYFCFAFLSIFELETRGAYVDLLGQAMIIVITAIFAGKTAEKIVDIRTNKPNKD
jgi:hypothetical protein